MKDFDKVNKVKDKVENINYQIYDNMDKNYSQQKFLFKTGIVQDNFKANIFDANFVNNHFTHYYDEI